MPSRFILTVFAIGGGVVAVMFAGLVIHDIAHRRLNTWSPFTLPYFDIGFLCCAVFLSGYFVGRLHWAVAARWAGPLLLTPLLFLQIVHNLNPPSDGPPQPLNLWNLLIQIVVVFLLPVGLAYFAGYLGDQRRKAGVGSR